MSMCSFFDRPLRNPVPSTPLDKIRVAAPCPVSWDRMTGDDRVRHCQECKLNVYNLSEMTRRQAERLIVSREGRLCVRFYRRADGTILTRNCPRGLRALSNRVSRIAGAVFSAMMSLDFANAQTRPASLTQTSRQNAQNGGNLMLHVMDATGATIQSAQVVLTDEEGYSILVSSDADGRARFELSIGTYTVSVSKPGFKDYRQTLQVTKGATTGMERTLRLDVAPTQGEVIGVKFFAIPVEDTFAAPELTPYKQQPLGKDKKHR